MSRLCCAYGAQFAYAPRAHTAIVVLRNVFIFGAAMLCIRRACAAPMPAAYGATDGMRKFLAWHLELCHNKGWSDCLLEIAGRTRGGDKMGCWLNSGNVGLILGVFWGEIGTI